MNKTQKKLYKWQREELTARCIFPHCDYPSDLESVMSLLPENVEFDGENFELIITPGYVRYVPHNGTEPEDIHNMNTMLCYSQESKAKSPTTLDACWQVLIALNNMEIIPIK